MINLKFTQQLLLATFLTSLIYLISILVPCVYMVTSVVLYSLTRATLMNPGKDERRVCGYIRSKFIHWAVWRALMRTEYFLFVHHTTNIFAKLSTWCFEHSGDIICSLLINSSHTDESCKGQNTCLRLLTFIIFVCYILSRYFKFEPGFKVRWCRTRNLGRARDLTY